MQLVKTCEACQFHAKQVHQPAQELGTILLSWPFVVWGLDILGPFPRAQGGYRYLYVAIDRFTRWPEVEPVRTIPARSAVKLINGITSRFGMPNRIITENGSQFTSGAFMAHCANIGSKICYTSVAHPRSNGQAEHANAEVLKGLKMKTFDKKLKACGKNWVDHLQSVLWSICTTATNSTRETPFSLFYRAKAVLPAEIKHVSPRVLAFNEGHQKDLRMEDTLVVEEARCRAAL